MSREASPKVTAYAALGGLALIAALVLRRPELAALGAPFLVLLGAGLLQAADPELRAVGSRRAGQPARGRRADRRDPSSERRARWSACELLLELPPGLTVADGDNPAAVHVPGGEPRIVPLRIRADRWGAFRVGDLTVRARDAFGLFARTGQVRTTASVKVFPRSEALRRLLRPAETQLYSGDELSRRKGEGLEFADLRPFAFGDRVRRINWRASARRGELWVNEQHPERNIDVVLFVDSFAELRRGATSTLDLAVRAAATLADRYVRRRDRVGLISFGGYLRWLEPGSGIAQLYRIIDALLDTEIMLSHAWKAIDVVPARTLPPQALVVAFTPLLDERSVRALLHLRARGFDLDVIELSPLAFVEPGRVGVRAARLPALAAPARGAARAVPRRRACPSPNGGTASPSRSRSRR